MFRITMLRYCMGRVGYYSDVFLQVQSMWYLFSLVITLKMSKHAPNDLSALPVQSVLPYSDQEGGALSSEMSERKEKGGKWKCE